MISLAFPGGNGRDPSLNLAAVKRFCLDCCAGDRKAVIWCTCDGLHSTRCEWWPFRLGLQPATVRQRFHPGLVEPHIMPSADVDQDKLPGNLVDAVAYLQERQPVEKAEPKRMLTEDQRAEFRERMARAKQARQQIPAEGSPELDEE